MFFKTPYERERRDLYTIKVVLSEIMQNLNCEKLFETIYWKVVNHRYIFFFICEYMQTYTVVQCLYKICQPTDHEYYINKNMVQRTQFNWPTSCCVQPIHCLLILSTASDCFCYRFLLSAK